MSPVGQILLAALAIAAWWWTGWVCWIALTHPDLRWGRRRDRERRPRMSALSRLALIAWSAGLAIVLTGALLQIELGADWVCGALFLGPFGFRALALLDAIWALAWPLGRLAAARLRGRPIDEGALLALAQDLDPGLAADVEQMLSLGTSAEGAGGGRDILEA